MEKIWCCDWNVFEQGDGGNLHGKAEGVGGRISKSTQHILPRSSRYDRHKPRITGHPDWY